ncbi:helix-turn-helix domain-containing protein [Komagataeibacter sp. FNDCF1]|uniref:helix-turn-helix domain-containing protein n=1 Tax=Komagataeibacter sp. FNDCF1 TaxID=2878681 RepID=UPI001E2C8314|nr:helix-turn-helix domain-containing protein [Komagataeibacter sp. FNDCF1]MCE2566210.1 helix-turn-helix domain-containing protein [Komagataeibacter sp. FNDCF1]
MIEQAGRPVYASIPGIMAAFSISEATVHRLLNAGAFGSCKIGRARRIKIAEVEAYFESRRDQPDATGTRIARRSVK